MFGMYSSLRDLLSLLHSAGRGSLRPQTSWRRAGARDEAEEAREQREDEFEVGPAALVPNRLATLNSHKKFYWTLEEDRFLLENYVK